MRILPLVTAIEAATFGVAALLHLGLRISAGPIVLAEPVILPATVVEALIGLGLAVSAYALFTERPWAESVTLAAYALGVGGVLLGMAALAAGRGPHTDLNEAYHRVMLAVLLGSALVLIWRHRAAAEAGAELSS